MANTFFDARQVESRAAQPMIGSAVNDTLDTVLPKVDAELSKLFENSNFILAGGGTIAVNGTATSVTFSSALQLHVNSLVAGGAPAVIDLAATTRAFSADLRILYAVINRTAATATVTADSATLPAVTSANQEVVLIAKRIGTNIFFRNGVTIPANGSTSFSGSSGSGDVVGPASSTDEAIARFDGTTGKLIQNSVITATDAGILGGITQLNVDNIRLDGNVISSTDTNGNITLTPNGSGIVDVTKDLNIAKTARLTFATDSATTGSAAVLSTPGTSAIRVTNASLVSIGTIPAGTSGQILYLENATGVSISLLNDTGATAANRIYTGTGASATLANQATTQLIYDTTTARWLVSSGSGSGASASSSGINYISNPSAETDTTGWATYADAAAVSPVDGTGGSPTLTFTRTTSTPLRGTGSFLVTKDAANRQGNGASYDFTIDVADKGKVLAMSCDYSIASGTYADDDLSIWIYDVTNAIIIQPAPYKLKNHTLASDRFFVEFQASSSSVSYRLIIHCASTSAVAYTVKFDNFILGPQSKLYGSPITDFASFTPTGSKTTNTSYTGYWRRDGDIAEFDVTITYSGAPAAGTQTVNIPFGWVVDTSKIASFGQFINTLGTVQVRDAGTASYLGQVIYNNTTTVTMLVSNNTAFGQVNDGNPITFGASDTVNLKFRVPIVGWSSSSLLSNDASTRVIAARTTNATATITSSYSTVTWTNVASDTHGALNGTSSVTIFTAPVSGFYDFTGHVLMGGTASLNSTTNIALFNNTTSAVIEEIQDVYAGAVTTATGIDFNFSSIFLNAGTQILIQIKSSITLPVISSSATLNYLQIKQIQGPAQIMASDTIAICAQGSSTSLSGTAATIAWTTTNFDRTGAFDKTTGIFTAPVKGVYMVNSTLLIEGTYTSSQTGTLRVVKGASTVVFENIAKASSDLVLSQPSVVGKTFDLLAGDTLKMQALSTATSPILNAATNERHFLSITKVGN